MVLAAVLPFERSEPVLSISGHNLRSVHALALVVVSIVTVDVVREHLQANRPGPSSASPRFAMALAALLWLALLSTLLADDFQLQAGMSFRRLGTGIIVALLAHRVLADPADRLVILHGYIAGATLAAVIGLARMGGVVTQLDSTFWGRPTQFGAIERLTTPFGHANLAAAHLATAVALGAVLLTRVTSRESSRHRLATMLLATATAINAAALTLTLSRTALLAAAVAMVAATITTISDSGRARPRATLGVLGLLAGLVAVNPAWHLRVASPGPGHWYAVGIEAPASAAIGETVSITITNLSNESWNGSPEEFIEVRRDELDLGESEVQQISLPALASTESTTVAIPVGESDARLHVDVHRPGQGRFLRLSGRTPVAITVGTPPDALAPPAESMGPLPRIELWKAATTLVSERPITGVGVGNFRLHYQRVSTLAAPQTSHAHSMVFEPLASWGIPAAVLFWAITLNTIAVGARRFADQTIAAATCGLGVLLLVGLTDWVLASASGGLSFWLLVGLINNQHSETAEQ